MHNCQCVLFYSPNLQITAKINHIFKKIKHSMKALSGFGITWSISMSLGKAPGHSMATLTMSAGGGMAAYGALAALSRKLQDDHPHLARSQTHLCHLALYTLKNAQASFQIQRPYCNDDDHCHHDDRHKSLETKMIVVVMLVVIVAIVMMMMMIVAAITMFVTMMTNDQQSIGRSSS